MSRKVSDVPAVLATKPEVAKNVPITLRAAEIDKVRVKYKGGGIVAQTRLVASVAVARGQAEFL